MGCGFSRTAGPNAPHPGGPQTPQPATDQSQPQSQSQPPPQSQLQSNADANPTGSASRPRRRHSQRPTSQPPQDLSRHIDKPLRRHQWTATHRLWTRSQLDVERENFFHTRVSGNADIWQALRAALQVMWEAERNPATADNEDPHGLATAQSILRAIGVTLPTGDLTRGVYDASGIWYALPSWVVCDPINVSEDSRPRDADGSLVEDDEDELIRRREEKGKGIASTKDTAKVRARVSETERDVVVRIGLDESVRSLAAKIAEEANLPPNKRIRVAYLGKILKESSSLETQGWQKGNVVNALVFDR